MSQKAYVCVSMIVLVLPEVGSGQGAKRWNQGSFDLLKNAIFQRELRLTPEQLDRVSEFERKSQTYLYKTPDGKFRPATIKEVHDFYTRAVTSILDQQQITRFEQLLLRRGGGLSVTDPAIAKALRLTEQQQSQVRRISEAHRAEVERIRSKYPPARQDVYRFRLRASAGKKIYRLFSPEQRKIWKRLIGPPVGRR